MINNITILLIIVFIVILYIKRNYEKSLVVIGSLYIVSPVIKLSGNIGFNPAYIITLTLILIFCVEIKRKNIKLKKMQLGYLICTQLGAFIIILAGIISNNISIANITHFIGSEQYIIGVFLLSVLHNRENINTEKCFLNTILIGIFVNVCFGFLQMFSVTIGGYLTKHLYTYEGKESQINDVIQGSKRFIRIMGTYYSPTVLGIFSLLASSYFLGSIAKDKHNKKNYIFYSFSLILGLFAFSKTVIIGVWFLLISLFIFLLINKDFMYKKKLKKIIKIVIMTFGVYLFVCIFASSIGLGSFVRYYFFQASNLGTAMDSRYGNILESNTSSTFSSGTSLNSYIITNTPIYNSSTNSSDIANDGNLKDAFEVFLEHPILGVGANPINGEFVGDSEYISILHNGGILCFLIYALFFLALLIKRFKENDIKSILVLLVLGMGCFSLPVFSLACTIPFLAYVIKN